MNIYAFIERLRACNGTIEKLNLMRENSTSKELANFLHRVYEPSINYYITPQPYTGSHLGTMTLEESYVYLSYFSSRVVTGNEAKAKYLEVISMLNREDAECFKMILNRDIRANINVKQINKVWHDLISTSKYMRCVLPTKSKIVWDGSSKFSQKKEDGEFLNITVYFGDINITTRAGSKMPLTEWFNGLYEEIMRIGRSISANPVQFHGEMILFEDGKLLPRKTSNGILNSLLKTATIPPSNITPCFIVWDVVCLQEIMAGRSKIEYEDRFKLLREGINKQPQKYVKLIKCREITTLEEALEHYREIVSQGGEGTIIKDKDMCWMDGDNPKQVKMKLFFEVDLKIVDLIEGTGKNEGALGAFLVESSDGKLSTKVGTGMSDKQRKEFWENKDNLIGTILSVGANDVIFSKTNETSSLFLPRFVAIRHDKSEADDMETINNTIEVCKS